MSKKYKFSDNDKLYFVTFTVVDWIDVFIRNEYKDEILKSVQYCQDHKDLELYSWVIMTSHIHMIVGTKGNPLQNIMRDLKRHTSEVLHKCIRNNSFESRKEWMLASMRKSNMNDSDKSSFQFWQPESHPVLLLNNEMAHQKLDYIHYNPVEAGFVSKPEEFTYSSAIDYYGGKGLLKVLYLDTLVG